VDGQIPNANTQAVNDETELSVDDNTVNKSLTSFRDTKTPQGRIRDPGSLLPQLLILKPILWAFRIQDTKLGWRGIDKFQLSETKGLVGNQECLILENPAQSEIIWVDPARGYSIVRYIVKNRLTRDTALTLNISYTRDPVAGWVPAEWTSISQHGTTSSFQSTSTVTKCKINDAIATEEFVLEFPPGTLVVDSSGGKDREYYQLPNAVERELAGVERFSGLTYDQALREGRVHWIAIAASLVVAGTVAILLLLKIRKRRQFNAR
jgi:hypothetical protein